LGIFKTNIGARKCQLNKVSFEQSKLFLEKNHLQGFSRSSLNLGLYYENELVQIATFSKSRFNKNYEWELLRFCTKQNIQIVGGFSKLLNYFKQNYFPNSLISYADLRFSTGSVYIKNGFSLKEQSPPNYFYTKDHATLFSRLEFQKHKLKDILPIFDSNLTEWENMQLNGYDRIWDCGNLVFIWEKNT
jgi:hypothetical protein